MKLVGELKDKVEKAETKVEAKKIIEEAGMELTDEEMDQVAGGPCVFNDIIKHSVAGGANMKHAPVVMHAPVVTLG